MEDDPVLRPTVSPIAGTVVEVLIGRGETVRSGRPVVILESMKMEHEVLSAATGRVYQVAVEPGDVVAAGDQLLLVEEGEVHGDDAEVVAGPDPTIVRADLAEVIDRHALTGDDARPDAVAKRHSHGHRTARENLDDLCDPGTFVEYGALAVAAQRDRRAVDDLIRNTPADGFIGGVASVGGERCIVASYDYMVLAGTQGYYGHHKKDRLFELAERLELPVILFAEGGGGRPGDTAAPSVSGLEVMAFALFGRLSGLVPLVGVVSGRCFAGNAALLGCCDVIIATEDSSIGMAGPAMIEGGGLGTFHPDEVGPVAVQAANGVIDVLVADEAAAVAAAKKYLAYFRSEVHDWDCPDQELLRGLVPEDRLRVYDVRGIIRGVADTDSVLELRSTWAPGIITALIRLEGRSVGVIANNPGHLGGAIDADGADKAARFLQLCDAFDVPVMFLCDTPGFMVGPEAEKTAQVRHFSRLFVIGGSLTIPFVTVILRKGYGLGAQAMAGGSFRSPALTVAWPTGEIGGMGLEGAVHLGFRKELDAEPEPDARQALFDRLVAGAYRNGKALNAATHFEIDDVIDPAAARDVVLGVLRSFPGPTAAYGQEAALYRHLVAVIPHGSYAGSMAPEMDKTDEEWRAELSPEQYEVLRRAGTERPWSGKYVNNHDDGTYRCAGCGAVLFDASTKFESGSGWPSFYEPAVAEAVETVEDRAHGMVRVEVRCRRCGGHLGHVFEDGPQPTGLRYCMNSLALDFEPTEG